MLVTLEEMKGYLRVDYEDDDLIIESLINTAQSLILDIARVDIEKAYEEESFFSIKMALFYAVSYLYEHREEADYKELTLNLRALLFNVRRDEF